MTGYYKNSSENERIIARKYVLERKSSASLEAHVISVHQFNQGLKSLVQKTLQEDGIAVIQFKNLPGNQEYLTLGKWLGELQPETSPDIEEFIEDRYILNVLSKETYKQDASLQPFTGHYLTLHTEGSRLPLSRQPRYISLLCHAPGDASHQSNTLMTPMKDVMALLTLKTKAILRQCKYYSQFEHSPILIKDANAEFLCFRDFFPDSMAWQCMSDDYTEKEVNEAITELLKAMYNPSISKGISWKEGMLVIFDNRCYFHGKTKVPATDKSSTSFRHLKRLRILNSKNTPGS